jgi:hypothetical protein
MFPQDDSYVRYYAVRSDGRVVPENKENWTLERHAEQDMVRNGLFLGQRPLVPLLLLGTPLFPIILFLSTIL